MPAYTNNDGNQTITWGYLQNAESQSFNALLRAIMKPGIYEGGLLSKISDIEVSLAPYTSILYAVNEETVAIKVDTTTSFNLAISPTTPIVILRYEWYSTESNFVEAVAVDQTTIDNNDPNGDLYVIIGEAIFNGTVLESIDYSDREQVSKDADTLLLGDSYSINQTPTGGIPSTFSGSDTFVTEILSDIYARLEDLSGVENEAVKSRHVDKNAVSGITSSNLITGAEISYQGITPGTLSDTTNIFTTLQGVYNKLADLSGANNDSVNRRHINFGEGTEQISLKDFILGFAGSKDLATGFTDISFLSTDTLTSIINKILNSIYELADSLSASTLSSIPNLNTRLQALENEFRFANLPIGSMIMFDATGWVNNSTMPGWYACDGTNGTPDMKDKFVKAHTSAQHKADPLQNIGGFTSFTILESNLPAHNHTFSGLVSGNTGLGGIHKHTYPGSNDRNKDFDPKKWGDATGANRGMRTLNTAEAGEHQHLVNLAFSGSTQNVGSGQPINFEPRNYRVIFIRKMS